MFTVFYEEKLITILMFLSLLLSMITRIMIGILYQNMIRETENMSSTANKALKQCKLKFANCYQLNNGVANIPVFADKFLNRLKLGPFTYQTLYHLSGQMMLLSIFFAGFGICKCIIAGYSVGEILPFYIVSFLGLYLYFAVSSIADIKGRRRVLKTNLVDYLENHMVNRLAQKDPLTEEESAGRKAAARENRQKNGIELMPVHGGVRERAKNVQPKEEEDEEENRLFTRSEEKELEELLKEFLTS